MEIQELMVKYGFIKGAHADEYELDEDKGHFVRKKEFGDKLDKKHANEEVYEYLKAGQFDQYLGTGYPNSVRRHRLVYEVPDLNIEEPYFWILDFLKQFYPDILKIEDTFAASENSAFFGMTQQRLGLQQDRIGQYLATIGKMIKELFQMVRERRILKERLVYYDGALAELDKDLPKRAKRDEITLKGIFVDLVQGGGKSPASVYGMATNLEFVTLPDLFFDAPPFKDGQEMEDYVNNLSKTFNDNVLRVLIRHLRNFMVWKERTHAEHKTRENFTLKYLWQHYEIIQMYITWLKPYLKTVQRLSLKGIHQDSADLVSSFEGSMMDIEFVAYDRNQAYCVLATFNYRTRPHLKFQQEGYQRGPVHVGNMTMTLRVMDWTPDQIKLYKEMKEEEILELIGNVSASVKTSMDALGEELKIYLDEARSLVQGKEEKSKPQGPAPTTFMERMVGDFLPDRKKKAAPQEEKKKKEYRKNKAGAFAASWNAYNNFKKAHRMTTW